MPAFVGELRVMLSDWSRPNDSTHTTIRVIDASISAASSHHSLRWNRCGRFWELLGTFVMATFHGCLFLMGALNSIVWRLVVLPRSCSSKSQMLIMPLSRIRYDDVRTSVKETL